MLITTGDAFACKYCTCQVVKCLMCGAAAATVVGVAEQHTNFAFNAGSFFGAFAS